MNTVFEEFRSFIISAFSGVISGVIYTFLYFIFLFVNVKNSPKNSTKMTYYKEKNFAENIVDIIKYLIFFLISALIFKGVTYFYNLSDVRVYMLLGWGLGVYLYLKSFHKLFAIFLNVVYNKINETFKKFITVINNLLKRLKDNINERRKKAQGSVGGSVGRNNVTIYISNNSRVSNRRHLHKKKQNKRS